MKRRLSPWLINFALSIALTGLSLRAMAGDDKAAANPTGTWKLIVISTNAQARPIGQTLKLRLEGDKLTGTLSYTRHTTGNRKLEVFELPITEAKLEGSEIAFDFSHPPSAGDGPNANYSYKGKISGDTITGTFTIEWMGSTWTKDWKAERVRK